MQFSFSFLSNFRWSVVKISSYLTLEVTTDNYRTREPRFAVLERRHQKKPPAEHNVLLSSCHCPILMLLQKPVAPHLVDSVLHSSQINVSTSSSIQAIRYSTLLCSRHHKHKNCYHQPQPSLSPEPPLWQTQFTPHLPPYDLLNNTSHGPRWCL